MSRARKPHRSAVGEEIGQPHPFRTTRQEALVALLRTADRVQRYLRKVLEPAGVTHQQYNVLRILRGAGGELPTMEIRERMIERAPGITALLNRLERKELVERRVSRRDGRRVDCRLTAAGRALVASLDAAIDEADERALARLGEDEIEQLIELLDKGRASVPEC